MVQAENNAKETTSTNPKKIHPLWLAIGALALVVIFSLLLVRYNSTRNFLVVGKKGYSKSSVEKMACSFGHDKKISKTVVYSQVADNLKPVVAAGQLGVKISDNDIRLAKNKIMDNKAKREIFNKCPASLELLAKKDAIYEKVEGKGVKGYVFDFYFGQHLQWGYGYSPSGLNDPNLIKQDQAYAKKQANYYRNALINKTMKPSDVLKKVSDDPRLGNDNNGDSNHSAFFEDQKTVASLYDTDASKFILKQVEPGTSTLQFGKAQAEPGLNKPRVDIYYYFVFLEKAPKVNISSMDFTRTVNTLRAVYEK